MSYQLFDTEFDKLATSSGRQAYSNFIDGLIESRGGMRLWEDINHNAACRIIDHALYEVGAWTEDTLDENGFTQDFRLLFRDEAHATAFLLKWA